MERARILTQEYSKQRLAADRAAQGGVEATPAAETTPMLQELLPELPGPVRMARGGRPTVLTPQVKEHLCLLLSLGLSRRQAAGYLDIDHSTISHAAERDPDSARGLARSARGANPGCAADGDPGLWGVTPSA
jgi:hypothetical protein